MKHGKRYKEAAKLVDRSVLYDVSEAVSSCKEDSSCKV